jgi:hypothetical protein
MRSLLAMGFSSEWKIRNALRLFDLEVGVVLIRMCLKTWN